MNPLSIWSSSGIYTNLPYGYDTKFNGRIPEGKSENTIADRRGYDLSEYYEDYYYYDDTGFDYQDHYNKINRIDVGESDLSDVSILDSILDIILNRKRPKKKENINIKFLKPRFRPKMKYPLIIPEKAEEKTGGFDSILSSIGRAISNIGFFGILLPGILAGLLFMGVPIAQSMFAGASLITTFLLSNQNKSLLSPMTLDSMARYFLINILSVLEELSNDREGRISDDFPFCVNDTMVEQTILEQGCRGDFLNLELSAEVGVLGNTTLCREGSLPDIVHKIARQIVTIVGACEESR